MANKDKKIFKIEINGVQESIDAVKELNKELKSLDSKIKSLSKAKISVQVDGNVDNVAKKVSSAVQKNTNTNPLAKLEEQIEKNKTKELALQNEEYRKQVAYNEELKRSNKEQEAIIKQISQGIRSENGAYADTVAGLKAQYKDLVSELQNVKIGSDRYQELIKDLGTVNDKIKEVEFSYGQFARNVGNYPSGAKELVALFTDTNTKLSELTKNAQNLSSELANMGKSSPAYSQKEAELKKLNEQINRTKEDAKALESQLSKKLQVQVGGDVRYYDNLRQAMKELNLELQQMYLNGQTNTKQFDDTIKALARVKTAVTNVTNELNSYIGGAKALNDAITMMRGFSSIASIGIGFQQLFGNTNKELSETMQKFTSLSLIMGGLSQIQQQMNNETDIFGRNLKRVWEYLDGIIRSASKSKVGNALGNIFYNDDLDKFFANSKKIDDLKKQLKDISKDFGQIEQVISKFAIPKDVTDSFEEFANIFGKGDIAREAELIEKSIVSLNEKIIDIRKETPKLVEIGIDEKTIKKQEDLMVNLRDSLYKLADSKATTAEKAQSLLKAQNAMEESVGSLTSVIHNANGTIEENRKEIQLLTQENERLSNGTSGLLSIFKKFPSAGSAIVNSIKAISAAFKALAKSTVILYAVQLALELITSALGKLKKGWDLLLGNNIQKAVENFDSFAAKVDNARDKLEMFNKELERAKATGDINSLIAMQKQMAELANVTDEAAKMMQEFIAKSKEAKEIDFSEGFGNWRTVKVYAKDLEDLTNQYNELLASLKTEKHWYDWMFPDENRFKNIKIGDIQRKAIRQLMNEINNIDFSKGEEAFRQFTELIDQELYASSLANIDELFPEEKWVAGLKKRIEDYRNFAKQMYDINTNLESTMQKQMEQIEDNLAEAIKDPYERARKQRQLQKNRELEEANGNGKLIVSIIKKYARLEEDAIKAHNEELKGIGSDNMNRRYEEIQAEIDAMQDGLAKTKKQLELNKKQALDAARSQGLSKQAMLNITIKWNNEILKAEQDFTKQMQDAYKQRNDAILNSYQAYVDRMKDLDNELRKSQNDIKRELLNIEEEEFIFSFRPEAPKDDSIKAYLEGLQKYHSEMIEEQKRFNRERLKIDLDDAEAEYQKLLDEEKKKYTDLLNEYENYLNDRREALANDVQKGYITQEKADEELRDLERQAQRQREADTKAHADRLLMIDENYLNKRKSIEASALRELRDIHADELHMMVENYHNAFEKINADMESERTKAMAKYGFVSIPKEIELTNKAKKAYKQMCKDIDAELEKLRKKYDEGVISFADFSGASGELEGMKQNALQNLPKDGGLGNAQKIMQRAMEIGNALNDVWSGLSDIFSMQIEEEQRQLDHEKELLEERLSMLSDMYSQQQELTQQHADKIKEIETSIADARGDARDRMVDALVSEREEQIKSLKEEQRYQREQEMLREEEKRLEQQQKELDRKQFELDKKNKIAQAMMNTAQAVTSALSVQPFYVGLALSGVASAMGMAQIAMISRQKYYKDGGLLNGLSHSDGGIPIGNTGVEVEGNEFITNKRSTSNNLHLLEYINDSNKPITIADILKNVPSVQIGDFNAQLKRETIKTVQLNDDRDIYVSVVEIENAMDNLRQVRTLAGVRN